MSWKHIASNPDVSRDDKKRVQHYEHEQARNTRFPSVFTFEQVEHIAQLAYVGTIPDGTYSDDECCLWEALRREFHHYS